MKILSVIFFAGLLLTFSGTCSLAASGADLMRKWLPFTEDIIKLGKKAPKAAKSQMDEIIKRFPSLSRRSPDLINGIIAIEKMSQKSPVAGKMIESGINPVKIAVAAERYPARLKLGNEIGEMFAKMNPQKLPANLPPAAATAMRRIDGNYAKAGDSFLEMAARGGKAAVDIAERLYKVASSPGTYALFASGLLAWHMADPEGAEESIKEFFKEHVAPVVNATTQGIVEGGGDVVDKTLQSAEEQGAKLWDKHWKLISLAIIIAIFIFIPNLRRLVFAVPNVFFGKLLDRVQKNGKSPGHKFANNTDDKNQINIYRRR